MTNRRRLFRIIALAFWGLALAPVSGAFGQEAAASPTLDGSGWWNRTQEVPTQVEQAPSLAPAPLPITAVTVPPPPTAPEDGIYVANEASGPAAVGAVRYLGAGTGGGTLTLQVAGDAPATGTEELAACPIPGGFTPVQNGRWDAKPAYDEATCTVLGAFSEDGSSVTFALDATFVGTLGDLQAAIVPKPGSTTPFQLGFAKPGNDALVPTGGSAAAATSDLGSFDTGSFDTGTATFDAPAASTFDAPATDISAPDATEVAAPPVQEVAAAPAKAVAESRTARMVAVAMMLAIGAAFWWLTNQPERAPRLLGSVGGAARVVAAVVPVAASARPRGVGRFARPRTQPPTPI